MTVIVRNNLNEVKTFHIGTSATSFSHSLLLLYGVDRINFFPLGHSQGTKWKVIPWIEAGESVLVALMCAHTSSSTHNIAQQYLTLVPTSLHSLNAVKYKVYRIQKTSASSQPKHPLSTVHNYMNTILDTPLHTCPACGRLMFCKHFLKKGTIGLQSGTHEVTM